MSAPLRQWMPLDLAEFHDMECEVTTRVLGAYVRMLVRAWKNDGLLPLDPQRIGRIARVPERDWREALRWFVLTDEGWRHPFLTDRLEQTREETPAPRGSDFYASREWRALRYQALALSDGRCELCGRSKHDGIVLHVDHVRPRSKAPELALTAENLQVRDWRVDA